jgi:hypothetical protein
LRGLPIGILCFTIFVLALNIACGKTLLIITSSAY